MYEENGKKTTCRLHTYKNENEKKKLTRLFVILTAKLNFIHLFEEQKLFENYKIECVREMN